MAAAPSPKRAAGDPCPDSVQLGQNSPSHQNPPATYESLHVNARARMPYFRALRSAHWISASPYARETTSRARSTSRLMRQAAPNESAPPPLASSPPVSTRLHRIISTRLISTRLHRTH